MKKSRDILYDYFQNLRPDIPKDKDSFERVQLSKLIDSIEMIGFLAFLEETFNIQITHNEVNSGNFYDISSVINYVSIKKENQ